MKNVIIVFCCLLTSLEVVAQIPQTINYQAIARDGAGEPIVSGTVDIRFTITTGTGNFVEEHLAVPVGSFGLVNARIGNVNTGDFAMIEWTSAPVNIQVEINDGGGYQVIGSQPMNSVAFSIHSHVADSVAGVDLSGGASSQWIDKTNGIEYPGNISLKTDPVANVSMFIKNGVQYGLQIDNAGYAGGDGYGLYIENEDRNYISGRVGIGNDNPESLVQIGADMHILDKTELGFNTITTNLISDGAGDVWYQTNGAAALMVLDPNLTGFFLYGAGTAGNNPSDYSMNLKVTPTGVAIGGDGVNATLDMGSRGDGIVLPQGDDADRPATPESGYLRFHTVNNSFEGYDGSAWVNLGGSSSPWTTGSGTIYTTTDRVGIGTSSIGPVTSLHVINARTSNIFPMAYFETSGTGSSSATIATVNNAGQQVAFGTASNGSFGIYPGNNVGNSGQPFTITQVGNVGIGQLSPSEKLEVVGNIEISGDYKYATPKTSYYSVPIASIVKHSETVSYNMVKNFTSGAPNYMYFTGGTSGSSAYATTGVNLPHGATVTNLKVVIYDNNVSVDGTVGLYRVTGGNATLMVECVANNAAGLQTINNATVSNATIDNSNYSYAMRYLGDQNGGTSLRFYHVMITYEVDQAD